MVGRGWEVVNWVHTSTASASGCPHPLISAHDTIKGEGDELRGTEGGLLERDGNAMIAR